ncbi:DUF6255 family natural product biosynthesis protein [Streptomyces klenkii]|uniref:DUF6255 family natural product biosynthesis protein n=1 Tax=Streptomyces klenkii TaxID=1420899 RepID=UPI003BB02FAF
MRVRCIHAEGWAYPAPGEQRCRTCGTVRFTDYGALRPPGPAARAHPETAGRGQGGPRRSNAHRERAP